MGRGIGLGCIMGRKVLGTWCLSKVAHLVSTFLSNDLELAKGTRWSSVGSGLFYFCDFSYTPLLISSYGFSDCRL